MYSPSVASISWSLFVDLNEREERVGVVEALAMSMKREAPSVAVQSVNVDPVSVCSGLPDRVTYTATPVAALHRVKVVEFVMERVDEEEIVPDIAAPFPSPYARSAKVHDEILPEPRELIETAEHDIITAEPGVADATEMLSSVTLPPPTLTT